MMNVVGDEDTEDEGSINSELTAVSNSSSGWTDSGGFPTPPFRFLAHNRAHEAEMDEVIHRFYDGLENSGENWQEYFDTVWENLPDASDYIDGVADSPFPGWEIYWNQFLDRLYNHEAPFWGVYPPDMVRPTAEWIWDQHTREWNDTFGPTEEGEGLAFPRRYM